MLAGPGKVFTIPETMSAKPSKKTAASAPDAPTPLVPAAGAAPTPPAAAWLDSNDPRKRLWGKIIFAAVWVYVGALWLLALDQTFHWGIFGPKVPPVP
jgi:hypothetical protein